jgi:hypothetical protein
LMMPQKEDKWKAFFADLGRPTLRGIRKCPKCGTVNGTRGNSCKNKTCDVIFRGNGARKKASLESCQITTSHSHAPDDAPPEVREGRDPKVIRLISIS